MKVMQVFVEDAFCKIGVDMGKDELENKKFLIYFFVD